MNAHEIVAVQAMTLDVLTRLRLLLPHPQCTLQRLQHCYAS